ncbi:MAG: SCO family protein [Rhodocyclaceae bacterium]|nr:SCO family protein [Rhodocyclaceae bacterium]
MTVLLAACGEPTSHVFNSTNLTGATFARDFQLTDHTGQPRTLASYHSKVVMVFFGYTFCPEACPTTLGETAATLKLLGKDAERVQVLMVTIDPERDSQDLLAKYVPGFGPQFAGLRGDRAATDALVKEFRLVADRVGDGPNYTFDHTTGIYVYDPAGRLRLFAASSKGPALLAADLKGLLSGG